MAVEHIAVCPAAVSAWLVFVDTVVAGAVTAVGKPVAYTAGNVVPVVGQSNFLAEIV